MRIIAGFMLAIAVLLPPAKSYASHAMGTDITYECLGNGEYKIKVAFYRDCSGIDAPASITVNFNSSCISNGPLSQTLILEDSAEVSPLCPQYLDSSSCHGGPYDGVERYIYTGIIYLSNDTLNPPIPCADWIVGYSECCRNSNITNLSSPGSYNLYAYAQINNTGGICNNSPVFTTLPVPFICDTASFNYNQGAVDPDGDSLVYHLIQPLSDSLTAIPPSAGSNTTFDHPVSTTLADTFQFSTTTGQISFTPAYGQYAVITVQVEEYRNGAVIGSTMRDMQVVVGSKYCKNHTPVVIKTITNLNGGGLRNPLDSTVIQMCPGTPLSFEMVVSDADGQNINLSSNASTSIPGSNFSMIGTGDTVTGRFSWTPTLADIGFFSFQVTYSDVGCPVSTPQSVTYVIYVYDRVVADPDQAVYCGDSVQLNAYGGSVFSWSPLGGLSATNTATPKAAPTTPTKYYVTSDCNRTDSVFVNVQPSYTLDAGKDTTICINGVAQLHATVDPLAYGPYSYSWSPSTGFQDPSNIANPKTKPRVPTTYVVTSYSAQGCMKRDTVNVDTSGIAPSVVAIADPSRVCSGETTQLELTIRPPYCGPTSLPCNGTPIDYDIGVGTQRTATNFEGTPYKGIHEDERVQYLYRDDELNALGITGGTITKIAFYVPIKRSTKPYSNFTIKMGCTPLDILEGFDPGVTTVVYGPTAYTTTSNWNVHVLTTPYDWDGVSNLIIQVCYNNGPLFNSQNDEVYYTKTSFSSVAYHYDDLDIGCNLSDSDTTKFRPNTRFSICSSSLNNAAINWELDSLDLGKSLISNSSISNPTAQVFGTSTYMANVSLGGCWGEDPVTITVDTTITVIGAPDTSLCQSEAIQLNATGSGQPSPIYLTCGVNGTPASISSNYQIGASSGLSTSPNPYQGNYHDSRMQMLFTRRELEDVSMKRGVFTSIAFNIAYKKSTAPFKGFTIKMGCTDLQMLGNSFEPNLQVVFNPKDISTTTGWNIHNFDNYFDWDGFSNVIVEVCFDNTGFALEDFITYSPTSFVSVIDTSADYSVGCNLPKPRATGDYSTKRPNVIFGVSPPPLGTFTYSWSPSTLLSSDTIPNPIANPVTTTSYVVTFTDGICIAKDTVEIDFYSSFDVNVYGSNVGCNGSFDGNAVSVPIGGVTPYLFIWNTGRTTSGVLTDTLYNLYAGTYQITVVDNNGCDASDSVTLTVPPPLAITNIDVRNVNCFNGNSGTARASGIGGTIPYRYLWSDGDTGALATQLIAGLYNVTLTDAGGCTALDSATINQPLPLSSTMDTTDASCYKTSDGTATVSVSGGTPPYRYRWTDNQTDSIATGLIAGLHIVTVNDDSNCVHIDSAQISQPDSFSIIITTQDVSCFGGSDGSASASVIGDTTNYFFYWDVIPPHTSASVSGLSAGQIRLTVTDTVPCPISSNVIIGSPEKIVLSSSATNALCYGYADGIASVKVDSGGTLPFRYLWNNGLTDSSITGLASGSYVVTVSDNNDCLERDTITINQPMPIDFEDSVINVSCFGFNDGRIIPINISGGTPSLSWLWSDGQVTPIADGLYQGIYSVTVTDRNGCRDSLSDVVVSEPMEILIEGLEITPPCSGSPTGAILFTADGGTPPYQYMLDDSISQATPDFTGISEGMHNLIVTDENGCTIDSPVVVVPYDTIDVAFDTSAINLNLGEEVTLNPIIQPLDPTFRIIWEPSTGLSCDNCITPVATPFVTTAYLLTVSDEHCSYTEKIVVNVNNNLILVVPNAFTPNGDGLNDILFVQGISVSSLLFQVFDRWGEKIFETRSIGEGWDGSFKGKMLSPDVFVYYAEAVFDDGQRKHIKGGTTILK